MMHNSFRIENRNCCDVRGEVCSLMSEAPQKNMGKASMSNFTAEFLNHHQNRTQISFTSEKKAKR